MQPALMWLIAGLILLIIELFHGSLFLIWIGAAALLTALLSVWVHVEWVQWVFFAVISIILLIISRPLVRGVHGRVVRPSNVDSLIGMEAVVLETIDSSANTGRVRVRSDEWRARSSETIPQGTRVQVQRIEGTTLQVKPIGDDGRGTN